jgi:hypothetical protein
LCFYVSVNSDSVSCDCQKALENQSVANRNRIGFCLETKGFQS